MIDRISSKSWLLFSIICFIIMVSAELLSPQHTEIEVDDPAELLETVEFKKHSQYSDSLVIDFTVRNMDDECTVTFETMKTLTDCELAMIGGMYNPEVVKRFHERGYCKEDK